MNRKYEETLLQVAEDTFASMSFILPAGEDEWVEGTDSTLASAYITFSGPFDGGIFLSVSHSMLPIMAANMLGVEECETISHEEKQDILTEILNVICGNLLPQIASPKDIFHLHQPRIAVDNKTPESFLNADLEAKICLPLECGRAELSLYINQSETVSR